MFAVVRTGGKQYRVAPGDKIVVEKLDGNAGDRVTLGDVLLAGDGGDLKSTDGLVVAAEIVAQAKSDKVTVFKKRRRHNYRRKKGHRQQHTILRIVAVGDHKAEKPAKAAKAAPAGDAPAKAAAPAKKNSGPVTPAEGSGDIAGKPTENPAPQDEAQANPQAESSDAPSKAAPAKAAPAKAAPAKADKAASGKKSTGDAKTAKPASTKNAAPAKAAAKKTPKAK
jgi:large subunit ribosomal protein L21